MAHGNQSGGLHHHSLSDKTAITVGLTLFFLTILTVAVAQVDLGPINFLVAMLVATIKASLVISFFMGLKSEPRLNAVMFLSSVIFFGIFVGLTASDLFMRGDVYFVKGENFLQPVKTGKAEFVRPWISTPEIVAHGKAIYGQVCVTCHGEAGQGNGAAAAALNPKPRNFTQSLDWKNGRSLAMIYKTLTHGLPPSAMASYATMSPEDRLSLAHYVLTFNPEPPLADAPGALAAQGIDTTKEKIESSDGPTVPVEFVIEDLGPKTMQSFVTVIPVRNPDSHLGIYAQLCQNCHGDKAQGGVLVGKNALTKPLRSLITDQSAFTSAVVNGVSGSIMPGFGSLTQADVKEISDTIARF
jgi:caa(3)-type oxidase subunit IV